MDEDLLQHIIASQKDLVAVCTVDGVLLGFCSRGQNTLYGTLASRMEKMPLCVLFGDAFLEKIRLALHVKNLETLELNEVEDDQWYQIRISPLPFLIQGKEAVSFSVINNTDCQKRSEQLKRLSFIDPLTGVSNRRMLDLALVPYVTSSLAKGSTVTAVIFDIDHFKTINDTFGHSAGDMMLKHTAGWGRSCFPGMDIVRFGGDEFVLFAVDKPVGEMVDAAHNLCNGTAKTKYKSGGNVIPLTLSIGIASSGKQTSCEELFQQADKALYQAKKQGRNRVVVI